MQQQYLGAENLDPTAVLAVVVALIIDLVRLALMHRRTLGLEHALSTTGGTWTTSSRVFSHVAVRTSTPAGATFLHKKAVGPL
jgi:hypothetical protein